jgi:Uri superfamily endonuclease
VAKQPSRVTEPVFAPALDAWPDAGVYQLWIRLHRPVVLRVGSFGRVRFAAGTYVYTGRAARGLRARVLRHVRGGKHRHWHIDYLLASRAMHIEHVMLASTNPEDECRVNMATGCNAVVAVLRFGASDCRSGCPTHLWRVG